MDVLDGAQTEKMVRFKHIEHVLTESLVDGDDELRVLTVRCNMHAHCSDKVRVTLYNAYRRR